MRSAISVLLSLCILFSVPSVVFGINVQETLDGVNKQRYPASLQTTDTQVGYLSFLCDSFIAHVFSGWLDQMLLCGGTRLQNIEAPAIATVKITEQDLALLEKAVEQLESGSVAGTESAQVQGIFDFLTVLDSVYHDKETGFTRNYTPAGKDFTKQRGQAGAEESTRILATKQLMPAARGASQPQPTPTATPGGSGTTPGGGMCSFGSNDCSVENLKKYFSTELAAQQASIICQKESGSNPASKNKSCTSSKGGTDYSIGLFQANLIWHCDSGFLKTYHPNGYNGPDFIERDVMDIPTKQNGNHCAIHDQGKLDLCEEAMLVADSNIKFAVEKSSDGQNWTAWSAARACNIVGGQPLPTAMPTSPLQQPTPAYASCVEAENIKVPNTTYQHLEQRHSCVVPKMFVMHWSASWSTAQDTFNTLNELKLRGDTDANGNPIRSRRSCQFAIDANTTLQMLDFYKTAMRKGWCAGGIYNDMSINFEISGVYFDEVITNPNHSRYADLIKKSDKVVELSCWAVDFYGIDKRQVVGHFEIQAGKKDPGPEYLKYIKQRILNECSGPVSSDPQIASAADHIYNGIYNHCKTGVGTSSEIKGRVTKGNNDTCIDAVSPAYVPSAVTAWKNSANSDSYLQCAALVYGAKREIQGENIPARRSAIGYWNVLISGYKRVRLTDNIMPRPGDLVVWDLPPNGHVAYIFDVLDADTVFVLEGNWDASGRNIRGLVRKRKVELDNPTIPGWLTPQS